MTPPFLSAIVRTQGQRPRSLAEAVDSLLEQTDDDLEILVVAHGDAGTANSVIEQLASRADHDQVRLLSVSFGGRSAPLNTGLAAATGLYVGFLDDDDLARPDWVATFRRGAEAQPGAVIRAACLSQRWSSSPSGEPLNAIDAPHSEFPASFELVSHFYVNATPICSIALPRQALADADLQFDERLPVLEDWDLFMRAVCALGIESVETATSIYRRVEQGNSFELTDDEWREARAHVLARLDATPLTLPVGSASALAAAHQARLEAEYQLNEQRANADNRSRFRSRRRTNR